MKSDEAPELTEAFPEYLRPLAREAVALMPDSALPPSSGDVGPVSVNRTRVRIPARIYNPEVDWPFIQSLGVAQESIVACLYTRHHDGHVRGRALEHIRRFDEWAAPFVIQLLGEYVIELIARAAILIENPPQPIFVTFLRENPQFLELTTARATSYWNAYYRQRFWQRETYPALSTLAALRAALETAA